MARNLLAEEKGPQFQADPEQLQQRRNLLSDAFLAGGPREAAAVAEQLGPPAQGLLSIRNVRNPETGEDVPVVDFTPKGQRFLIEAAPQIAISAIPGAGVGGIALKTVLAGLAGGGSSLLAEGIDPSEDPASRAIISALVSAGPELFIGGGGAFLGKPSAKLKTGAEEVIESLAKEGQRPLPATVTTSFGTDILQTAGESSLLAGGAVKAKKGALSDLSQRSLSRFIGDFGEAGSREEAGIIIGKAMEDVNELKKLAVSDAYRRVDTAGGFTVDIRPLKEFALEQQSKKAGLRSQVANDTMTDILSRDDFIQFEEAGNILSDLGGAQAPGGEVFRGKVKGSLAKSHKILSEQIDTAGDLLNPNAKALWKEAKSLARERFETFDNKFIKSLFRTETPERVFDIAVRNAQPSSIRRVRKIVLQMEDGKELWSGVQGQFLAEAARDASKRGQIIGRKFVDRLERAGKERLEEIFPSATQRKRLRVLGDQLDLTQADPDSGAFGLAFRFGQLGGLFSIAMKRTPQIAFEASTILLGPAGLAHFIKSETAFKLLVSGFKAAPGTRQAFTISAKLIALLNRDKIPHEVEKQPTHVSI